MLLSVRWICEDLDILCAELESTFVGRTGCHLELNEKTNKAWKTIFWLAKQGLEGAWRLIWRPKCGLEEVFGGSLGSKIGS